MNTTRILFVAGLLFGTHALAGTDRVPITDPAELVAMGFPADATNVWRLVGAGSFVGGSARPDAVTAWTYNSHSMTGDDFTTVSSQGAYNTGGNSFLVCPAGANDRISSAAVELPTDRSLAYLDIWGKDATSTEAISVYLFETCQPADAAGLPSNTVLAQVDSPDAGGDGYFFSYATIPTHYTDTQRCSYSINVALGSGTCVGADLTLHKVRVMWDGD